jgi:hypothetical protein
MGIKRYFATKDNTITNAYKANLETRGVSGNMGQSDILEIFHIYGQASSASQENCKVLVQFNTDQINTDRTAGTIPASGSVNFFLKLYNAEHSQTTPKDFTLVVTAVSQSWQEGLGLDMENYSDLDESNWIYATDVDTAATATITLISTAGEGDLDTKTFGLTGSNGDEQLFTFNASNTTTTDGNIGIDGENVAAIAKSIVDAINDATVTIGVTASPATPVAVDGDYPITLTQDTAGDDGNTTIVNDYENADVIDYDAAFTGGSKYTSWTTEGGDYITGSDAHPFEYTFTQDFDTGFENLEIDVSHLVEDWINEEAPVENNYGFGVHLASSLENAENSYYTKMFFARGSQFFFKRPVLEARWDNSKKDNRGNFYLSSSLVPANDNLMKLYLYNVVKGNLTDIPAVGTDVINVSIYSGSANNTSPSGSKIGLSIGGGTVAADDINTTASWVETGVYSCSFAYTSSAITTIFDVWHSGGIEYHTGSAIALKTYDSQDYNIDQNYVSNITNLHSSYSTSETARFRLYIRKKDWSPTIYSVSSNTIETSIVEDVYYQITRVQDSFKVVPFGTGSLNYTRLSYDASGSYFDLKMDLFDTDTVYEMNFTYLINGNYVEQSQKFRFRVD